MLYGVGKNLELMGGVGLYITSENRFEKAQCLSNLIYTVEGPFFFEGIPRNFIIDIFRFFLEHNKIEKKETFILPTVFDLTYFNEAFFFYLYGYLKSRLREFFPDNLEIVQPMFFKDPKLGTQSNHNSWTDSDMASLDHRTRRGGREPNSLTEGRMSSRPSLDDGLKLNQHKMFRSDNQKFQLPVAPPLVQPRPEPKFTSDSGDLPLQNYDYRNQPRRFGPSQPTFGPDNEIEEVDKMMIELSQNIFNKKNKVVLHEIQQGDGNPTFDEMDLHESPINHKEQSPLLPNDGGDVFRRNFDMEAGFEKSRLSKDNDESAMVKNLKMQQEISFGFRSDYSKSLKFSRQEEADQDDDLIGRSYRDTNDELEIHQEASPQNSEPPGVSNAEMLTPRLKRDKNQIAQSLRRKLELVFGREETKKICSANSFLARAFASAK